MPVLPRRLLSLAVVVAVGLGVWACAPSGNLGVVRLWTDDFEIRLKPDIVPPYALERITYTVNVFDKSTKEPIVDGEGRIFATNKDGKSVWNGLSYGPEVGTYRTTITFVTAGEWAMAIQFRRDSTEALQRSSEDWRQSVRNERPPSVEMAAPAASPPSDSTP